MTGNEPDDGYPVLLRDWIREDGLDCLKVKLRGNDQAWDADRLRKIGAICRDENVTWLTTDFNCTVTDPEYVNEILDELKSDDPVTYQKILYVEQPFPYDLEKNRIDVHGVSARKPLFMDESAHDWKFVRMGRDLGWTGVALKTCKSQTGALLSAAWATAHGMTLMVQDLTNPDARPDSPFSPRGSHRNDHGSGKQCDAILSRSERSGSRGSPRFVFPEKRTAQWIDFIGIGLWVSSR